MSVIPLIKPTQISLNEYRAKLDNVWESNQYTNDGMHLKELERKIASKLGLSSAIAFSSCTAGLVSTLKTAEPGGEVITSPFTFLASMNSIILAGLRPIFVDIDPVSLTLDPEAVERAITDRTCGIMPVHVYGNPCDVNAFDKISAEYRIPVIYDAAQAFGVKLDGKSILSRGVASVLSTHATKIFSTVEGGFIFTNDRKLEAALRKSRNFGLNSPNELSLIGSNSKMSELHAAYGLCGLNMVDRSIKKRKEHYLAYSECLKNVESVEVYRYRQGSEPNYNYMPVRILNSDINMDDLVLSLKRRGIGSKRYFSPLVNEFRGLSQAQWGLGGPLPNATAASSSMLCLPMFDDLKKDEIGQVAQELQRLSS